MIPFLGSIVIYRPPDVRPILQAYHSKNIPLECAKKEAEAKAKHIEDRKNKTGASSKSFSSIFGLSSTNPAAALTTASGIPPTYLQQKRHEAQMQYQEEQKYVAEHQEELERLLAQEQEMAGEVPGTLRQAFDHFRGTPKEKDGGGEGG